MQSLSESVTAQLALNPLPVSQDANLHLGWCEGLKARPAQIKKPQISVVSTIVEEAQLTRSLKNPIPFSLFKRPSFNMHFATLNAVLECAALSLDKGIRPRFNAGLLALFIVCQESPGFWNGLEGIMKSMHVVDRLLREHELTEPSLKNPYRDRTSPHGEALPHHRVYGSQ